MSIQTNEGLMCPIGLYDWSLDSGAPLPQVNSVKSSFPFRKIPLQTLLSKVIWFSVIFIAKSISRACGVCFKNVKMHLFANFMHKSIHTKLKCQPRIKLHHLGLKKVNFIGIQYSFMNFISNKAYMYARCIHSCYIKNL